MTTLTINLPGILRSTCLLVLALLFAGCAALLGGHRVGAPSGDRCKGQPEGMRSSCEQARDAAVKFAHGLAVDDQVCIDGAHRLEEPLGDCRVRAFVESTAPDGVKLEIREAPADSKYPEGSDWWFSEEALGDIALRALGYTQPEEK
jgi:hypothetical protein